MSFQRSQCCDKGKPRPQVPPDDRCTGGRDPQIPAPHFINLYTRAVPVNTPHLALWDRSSHGSVCRWLWCDSSHWGQFGETRYKVTLLNGRGKVRRSTHTVLYSFSPHRCSSQPPEQQGSTWWVTHAICVELPSSPCRAP